MNAPERIWIDTSFIDSTRTMPVLAGNLGTAKPDRKLATDVEYRRADLPPTDAEVMKHPKVKALVEAAATLGRIIGFLGEDEGRINAFREACGDDLLRLARAIQEAKP